MSASAWSNATGKSKPSYAELLRRAKEEKSADGIARSGSAGPGASSTKLAVTSSTNDQASEPKHTGASEEGKARTEPSPLQHSVSITPPASDTLNSRSSNAHIASDRNGQNRNLSNASSSSPTPAVTGLKVAPANVWELRKLQKAEAAAALTAPQPASATTPPDIQSKRASTQEETAVGKRDSPHKPLNVANIPVHSDAGDDKADHTIAPDKAPHHTGTLSSNARDRIGLEGPQEATSIPSVLPQSKDGTKAQTKPVAAALSTPLRKQNQQDTSPVMGTTDNAWLDNINMLNGGQNLPTSEGCAAVAVDGMPASVIASASTTKNRNLAWSGDGLPHAIAAQAGSDYSDKELALKGHSKDKSRQAVQNPVHQNSPPEREHRDSGWGLRAQKKAGRVGGGQSLKWAHRTPEDSDQLPNSTIASKIDQQRSSLEPTVNNRLDGERTSPRGARTSLERHTEMDGPQAAKITDQRLTGSRHAARVLDHPFVGQETPATVGSGMLENSSTPLDTAQAPAAWERASTLSQPRSPARRVSNGHTSYSSPRESERLSGSPVKDLHPSEEWRGKSHPHTGRGRGGARGRGRGRGRTLGGEERPRQYSATLPMNNDGDWDSHAGNDSVGGANSMHRAQRTSLPASDNRARADSAGRAYDAPLMYPAYGPSMHFDGQSHYPPPMPIFEAQQSSWQHSGPSLYDPHPFPSDYDSNSGAWLPSSMNSENAPGDQATVWTSPRPAHGVWGGPPVSDQRNPSMESPVSRLVHQVEFYFSPQNLYKDSFLRQQMDPTSGWVPLALIQSFKRVRMLSQDVDLLLSSDPVLERLRHNPHVEMDDEGRRLRKRYGWQEWVVQPDGLMLVPPVMTAPMGPGVVGPFPPHDVGPFPHARLNAEGGPEHQDAFAQPQQGFWLPYNAQPYSGHYMLPGLAQPMSGYPPLHPQHWQPAMGGPSAFPPPAPSAYLPAFDPRPPVYQHPSPPMSEFAVPSHQASTPSGHTSSARRGSAQAPSNSSHATSLGTDEQHSGHSQSPQQYQLRYQQHHGFIRQNDQDRHIHSHHQAFAHAGQDPAASAYHTPLFSREDVASSPVDATAGFRTRDPHSETGPRVSHVEAATATHTSPVTGGQSSPLALYTGADGQHASYSDTPAHHQSQDPAARSSVDASSSAVGTPPLDSSIMSASSATSTAPSQRHQVIQSESPAPASKDGAGPMHLQRRSNGGGSQEELSTFGMTAKSVNAQSGRVGEAASEVLSSGTSSAATLTRKVKHLAIRGDSGSAHRAEHTQEAANAATAVGHRHQRADEEDDDDEDIGLGVIAAEGLGGLVGRGA